MRGAWCFAHAEHLDGDVGRSSSIAADPTLSASATSSARPRGRARARSRGSPRGEAGAPRLRAMAAGAGPVRASDGHRHGRRRYHAEAVPPPRHQDANLHRNAIRHRLGVRPATRGIPVDHRFPAQRHVERMGVRLRVDLRAPSGKLLVNGTVGAVSTVAAAFDRTGAATGAADARRTSGAPGASGTPPDVRPTTQRAGVHPTLDPERRAPGSGMAFRETMRRGRPERAASIDDKDPAATYSPTGLPRQYHRRWRA
jgi:hypothetical protein